MTNSGDNSQNEKKQEEEKSLADTVRVAVPDVSSAPLTLSSPGAMPPIEEQLCLSEDSLLDYVAGRCGSAQHREIELHLDLCDDCQELLHHWLQAEQPSQRGRSVPPAAVPTTFVAGSIVNGRYKIHSFIGRGGMGEVYEAFDQLMDIRVALKTLLCSRVDNRRALRRFREEARNALRIGHRHVCRINELQEHRFHDSTDSTVLFFTMEFIEGVTLGSTLRGGPLPLDEVQRIAHQLLEGLGAAHSQSILHLDFKSDNIMLRTGAATTSSVIMDFGLSRALDSGVSAETTERLQMAGTLPYMPVEQLECRSDLKPAADIYAFGVVLYEMLTGELPFRAQTLSAMLLKQLRERPALPSSCRSELTAGIDRFVMRCLQVDPDRRFPDAETAERSLRAIPHWQASPTRRRRRLQWLVALASVVCVVAVAALFPANPGARTFVLSAHPSPPAAEKSSKPPPPPPSTLRASPETHQPAPRDVLPQSMPEPAAVSKIRKAIKPVKSRVKPSRRIKPAAKTLAKPGLKKFRKKFMRPSQMKRQPGKPLDEGTLVNVNESHNGPTIQKRPFNPT